MKALIYLNPSTNLNIPPYFKKYFIFLPYKNVIPF